MTVIAHQAQSLSGRRRGRHQAGDDRPQRRASLRRITGGGDQRSGQGSQLAELSARRTRRSTGPLDHFDQAPVEMPVAFSMAFR